MELVDRVLGLSADELAWWQMVLRAGLAVVVLVALVRLGNKRLFAKGNALDMVVSIMVGSTMAQSIHSAGPILPVYAATATLVGVHTVLTLLAARVDVLGPLVKGSRVRLVRDGELLHRNMDASAITETELREVMRENGDEPDLSQVRDAWLERDGGITVSTRSDRPRVVDVEVRDGVQLVRLELG